MFIGYSFTDSAEGATGVPLARILKSAVGLELQRRVLRAPKTGEWFRALALAGLLISSCVTVSQESLKSLVQQAFALHQKGQYSEALALLRRANTLQPDDYYINLLLGIDTLRVGDSQASVPYLRKASRLQPREEYPRAYLGEAYARLGRFGDAAEAYLGAPHAAVRSPESSVAFVDFCLSRFAELSTQLRSSTRGLAAEYRLRAQAVSQGKTRLPLLEHSAELDSKAPGIWSEAAQAALTDGDVAVARQDREHALENDSNDLAAWAVDAQLAARAGDWRHAVMRLNAIADHSAGILAQVANRWPPEIQPPPESLSGSSAKFFSCVRHQDEACNFVGASKVEPELALFRQQRWEQLLTLRLAHPESQETSLRRGIAFANLQDCRHAIPSLEKGLSKTVPDVYGMFLLSWCYSREAGRTADQVQKSDENDPSLHVMRGDILLRLQSQAAPALAEYEQALNQNLNDPSLLERVAEAQFSAGKTEAARQSAQEALRIDPHRLGAKRTLAKIALQDRDYAAALPYLRELAARNPQDLAGQVELGRAYAESGAEDEARQSLAFALDKGYPDEKGSLHYLLGSVLKKLGRDQEANQAFRTATELSDAFQKKSYRDQDPDAQP